MRDRTKIKMKATSVDTDQADIYAKLNTAEAIKDMANNPGSSATNILGMHLGNSVAGMVTEPQNRFNSTNQNNNNNE